MVIPEFPVGTILNSYGIVALSQSVFIKIILKGLCVVLK